MAKRIESPVFGKLKHHRASQEYSAKMTHKDTSISIHFVCETDGAMDRLLPFGEKIWKGRVRYFKVFREYAVAELLEQLNGFLDCGEDDPPQVTAKELREILAAPFSITFFESGNDYETLVCDISGGDDPRLHEHCLTVYLDDAGRVTDGEAVSLF
ncbi:hypothetical protein [Novipirellula caenicola]|uniref:Uncharacterized protein n=1 Tax=Novipirellula caenicola TaxID=1536901 RepID=A0ABP9VVP5_9BACT